MRDLGFCKGDWPMAYKNDPLKTHMNLEGGTLCKAQHGHYQPPRLSGDPEQVTCKRCLKEMRRARVFKKDEEAQLREEMQ